MQCNYTISREGGIPLEEWENYLSQSSTLRAVKVTPPPPRQGVNPFTKKPQLYYPKPKVGVCSFPTTEGDGTIELESGELRVSSPNAEGLAVAEDIARSLNATIMQA